MPRLQAFLALLCAAPLAACSGGRSVATCTLSTDCATGQLCVNGICSDPGGSDGGSHAAPGELGAACAQRADCHGTLGCLTDSAGFPNGYCSSRCDTAACPGGSLCADLTSTVAAAKACLRSCGSDGDCRPGYSCCPALGNTCAPTAFCPALSGQPSPTLGAACASSASCSPGEACETGAAFPGGFCSRPCTVGDPATCPSNGQCVQTGAGPLCLPGCGSGICRTGYTCQNAPGTSVRVCQPPAGGTGSDGGSTGSDGGSAGSDGGSAGGDGGSTGSDGGSAGSDGGSTGSDGGSIGSDGGSAGGDGGVVFRTCTPPSTASTWHVVSGGTIGPSADPGACQKPVKASTLPAGQVQALGVHKVGEVLHFNVPPGTGTVSVVSQASSGVIDTVTYQGSAIDNAVIPTALTTPASTVLYDDNATPPDDGATAHVWAGATAPSNSVLGLPNTTAALAESASGYPSGSWSVTVNDYALECTTTASCSGGSVDGQYDMTVLTKPVSPTTGTVDVGIYVASKSFTATQAMSDARVGRFLSTLAQIYGGLGLCLGTITFYDLPAWAKNKYATGVDATKTGPCDGLDQMFALSQAGNTLSFFFVDAITQGGSTSGGVIVGIDGTIPGPSSIGGTVHSGAVVNASDLGVGSGSLPSGCSGAPNYGTSILGTPVCGPDFTAYITAHEGGHWMGLYHTTESPGGFWDPVADTGPCNCNATCAGASAAAKCCDFTKNPPAYPNGAKCDANLTQLDGAMCTKNSTTCSGGDMLMFWLISNSSKATVSAQQGKIVRQNPVVQ